MAAAGHPVAQWLRHDATSRKATLSMHDELNDFFLSIYVILPAAVGPAVYSAFNRSECRDKIKMFTRSRALPAGEADNLTPICQSIV
jgi:hypothetical protein